MFARRSSDGPKISPTIRRSQKPFAGWSAYPTAPALVLYPLIIEATRRIRTKQFVFGGEAVLLSVDGISDFDGLYSGQHNDEIQLYAFDLIALDGDDLRLPLHLRKTSLSRPLARRADGRALAVGV